LVAFALLDLFPAEELAVVETLLLLLLPSVEWELLEISEGVRAAGSSEEWCALGEVMLSACFAFTTASLLALCARSTLTISVDFSVG
jgi:hypothetical protein